MILNPCFLCYLCIKWCKYRRLFLHAAIVAVDSVGISARFTLRVRINVFWLVRSAVLNMFGYQFGSRETCLKVSPSLSPFPPTTSPFFHPFLCPPPSSLPQLSLHRSPQAEASYCSPCATSPPPTLWPWLSLKLATCPRLKTMDLQVHTFLVEPFNMQSMAYMRFLHITVNR